MSPDTHSLITLVVPVYNVEHELPRCIDSILTQHYTHTEILLVNDGSTDSSGAICDHYAARDPRVTVIHRHNGGLSAARNTGLSAARGDYVTFVDSDDWIDPRYLSCLFEQLGATGASISACDLHPSYDATLPPSSIRPAELLTGEQAFSAMMYQTGLTNSASGKLFTRAALQGFTFPEGRYFEDLWSIHSPIRHAALVSYSRTPLYCYVQRGGSIMNSSTFIQNVADLIEAVDSLETLIAREAPTLLPAVRNRKFSCYAQALYALCHEEDPRSAELWSWMRSHSYVLIRDRKARMKNRIAAASTWAGRAAFLALYGATKAGRSQ